ncbi:DUF4159 domain-containing protein [Rubinisphaera margarita]|uniref:DUF4159 domain-containing protein n=1 Tax=Rubinisphaera margarita TaxID=2909586 RepID=UPI001EE8C9E1|nr:DUF4159 domain-containing protein [Rubinisphaera margarita]MCG6154481.1 DUF4159 domain-containing protein [Rubinisphaera margarita]
MSFSRRPFLILVCLVAQLICSRSAIAQDELTAENVLKAIERGRRYLISQQLPNGSWQVEGTGPYNTGTSSLILLSLMEAGLTPDDPAIDRGLQWLRKQDPSLTYEVALMIMALTKAKEGARDNLLIFNLSQKLERGQMKTGKGVGGWGYSEGGAVRGGTPDRSNSQYAILGLRDAAYYGIPVDRKVWERVRAYWENGQQADGGWNYREDDGQSSYGSMTVAGVASLAIADTFLKDTEDAHPDGRPICCLPPEKNDALERGIRWLSRNFSVQTNPLSSSWWLYYMYGLERAGRLSGRRFFGTHDWYREGARALLVRQSKRDGSWRGQGGMETNPMLGTPLALLFLSKGLAPVLINKVKLGPRDPDDPEMVIGEIWNRHPKDVRNLVEHISSLPKWPKLLTWQTVDFDKAVANNNVQELLQAPILFITTDEDLSQLMQDEHVELLRDFLTNGGFMFLSRGCESAAFEDGLRKLVTRLYPDGTTQLMPLADTHPVYRSEYLLDPKSVPLFGVDVGCRTAIIYSPEDLGCLWDKRMVIEPPDRRQDIKTAIARALRIGVNVVAYVTGREPPNKLDEQQIVGKDEDRDTLRGILSIAKLRHTGDWDAAPNAVKKLLLTLEKSFGVVAGSSPYKIPAGNPELYRHTLLYMHGQRNFELSPDEIRNVRKYLENGGVLFADACCGAPKFDASFRELMGRMFPDIPLERIPVEHELFSQEIGHNLDSVTRRVPADDNPNQPLKPVERQGPPFLEGIKIDGRYAIIYSKYDISCALEKQTSLSCIGYTTDDAARIATNVVLYSVLQDVLPAGDE